MKLLLPKTFLKFLFMLILFIGQFALGQLTITAGGSALTQNFNAIVGSPGSLPSEWTIKSSTNVREIPSFSASGASTIGQVGGNIMQTNATGGIYRFNANGITSEAAIGGLSSSSTNKTVALYTRLKNNSATPIGKFKISYNVEK